MIYGNDQSRFTQARNEILELRNEGEDISMALKEISERYRVPSDNLKQWCEKQWGAPLETDIIRNSEHFRQVRRRQESDHAQEKSFKKTMREARKFAADTWYNCSPDGNPDWGYCYNRFIQEHRVEDSNLQDALGILFRSVGRDFNRARLAYLKLVDQDAPD